MSKRKINEKNERDIEILFDYPELHNPKFKKVHKQIVQYLNETEPTLERILTSPLLLPDRVALFQLFDIYHNIPDETSREKLETRKELITQYQRALNNYTQYHRYTEQEHDVFNTQLQSFERMNIFNEMKYTILSLPTNEKNKRVIYREYQRFIDMTFQDDEKLKLQTWLKWAIALPYDRISDRVPHTNVLSCVKNRLDSELFGMQKTKEQILIFLNTKLTVPNMQGLTLALLGPPGCGKTTIVKILSEVMHYPLEHISLGGINSPDYFKGHSYVYIGSGPGEIVKRLVKMGVKDGIFYFDEYDKIEDEQTNAALLHITDRSQNNKFNDNYLNGIDIDLGNIWMIFSMNRKKQTAKDDRLFYVSVQSYSQQEKIYIARDYLLKKANRTMGWNDNDVKISDVGISFLVERICPDSITSIRPLEEEIFSLIRKINYLICRKDKKICCSFDLGRKITFPIVLSEDDINRLIT